MNDIIYAAGAIDARPHPALTAAAGALLRASWPSDAYPAEVREDALVQTVGPFDVIVVTKTGGPPVFGQFGNCRAERRCASCHRACGDEIALVEFSERRQRPVLLVVAGMTRGMPKWLRIVTVEPGKIFTPVFLSERRRLTLACEDGGVWLLAFPLGLMSTQPGSSTPRRVSVGLGQAISLFSHAIPRDKQADLIELDKSVPLLSVER